MNFHPKKFAILWLIVCFLVVVGGGLKLQMFFIRKHLFMLCFFGFETSIEFFSIAKTLFCDVLLKEILNDFLLEGHLF
jgi:hypothetical protein